MLVVVAAAKVWIGLPLNEFHGNFLRLSGNNPQIHRPINKVSRSVWTAKAKMSLDQTLTQPDSE